MPLPIPEWVRQNLALDFAVGIPLSLGLYAAAETWTSRRASRRRAKVELRAHGFEERRKGARATEVAGRTDEQQAQDVAQAMEILVAFVDERPNLLKTRAVVRRVKKLVPPEQRGELTAKFLDHAGLGATPVALQRDAEQVCLQMAVELRAIRNRIAAAEEAASEARIAALRARRGRRRARAEPRPSAPKPVAAKADVVAESDIPAEPAKPKRPARPD